MKPIILASASPRRKALLEQIGLKFTVDASGNDEQVEDGVEPHQLVCRISLQKAEAVSGKYTDAIIIAADTIGVIDGQIIGKPRSSEKAREMLARLSGKAHKVITGLTVLDTASQKTVSRSVETTVYMKKLTSGEMDNYVKSGEPLDKAGAYAVQGLGAVIIERIEGDYFNVMGLPLATLAEVLREFGVEVLKPNLKLITQSSKL